VEAAASAGQCLSNLRHDKIYYRSLFHPENIPVRMLSHPINSGRYVAGHAYMQEVLAWLLVFTQRSVLHIAVHVTSKTSDQRSQRHGLTGKLSFDVIQPLFSRVLQLTYVVCQWSLACCSECRRGRTDDSYSRSNEVSDKIQGVQCWALTFCVTFISLEYA
jgi:hypothetical protein